MIDSETNVDLMRLFYAVQNWRQFRRSLALPKGHPRTIHREDFEARLGYLIMEIDHAADRLTTAL